MYFTALDRLPISSLDLNPSYRVKSKMQTYPTSTTELVTDGEVVNVIKNKLMDKMNYW